MSIIDQPTPARSNLDAPAHPAHSFPESAAAERIIKPSRGWIPIDWNELYQNRELFTTLVFRDVRIRYKQTVLGVTWAILQPLAQMFIFTMIFSNFPGVKPAGIPYPLFLLSALVPWTFFSNSVTSAGTSLLNQQHLLTKIYFPRLYVPLSTVGTQLVDMMIGFSLFLLFMPLYGQSPSLNLIFLPFVVLLTFAAALGIGLILSAVTVLYRDLRYVIPFMMQLFMYASPIFYQPSILPRSVQLIVAVNPVTGIITTYRWCILGLPLDKPALSISIVSTVLVLTFGLFFFRKSEKVFADIL